MPVGADVVSASAPAAAAGLVFGREAAQGAIVAQFAGLTGGQTAAALEGMIASASSFDSGMIGLLIGIATFVLLATGAIIELQDNLNIIWKAKPEQTFGIVAFVRTRLLSLTLVVGFGFLLMVSLILDAGLSWVGTARPSEISKCSRRSACSVRFTCTVERPKASPSSA